MTTITSTLPVTGTTTGTTLPATATSITGTAGSTTNTTSASTTAPVTTTQSPVDVAERKLSKSAIDNLWIEKVTTASFFGKLPGLLSYLWNRSTAVAADKQFGATIAEYNTKQEVLIKALAKRNLTPVEATKVGVAPLKFNSAFHQGENAQVILAAQTAEKEFYDVFKLRCTQLNVNLNSNDFGIYTQAAINGLTKSVKSNGFITEKELVGLKLDTAIEGFSKRIYVDMVDAFANQPAASITMADYDKKAKDIKGFFPSNSIVDVEASLRQALKAKNDQAFSALSAEFLNPAATNPKVAEIQGQLQVKFKAEEDAINAELATLRGTTGWNGTIHDANVKLNTAQVALDSAKAEFLREFTATFGGVATTSSIDTLIALDFATLPQGLQTAKATLVSKNTEFLAAKKEHDDLVARLAELAQYDGAGRVASGKLAAVQANLQPVNLGAAARDEATRVGNFYRELHTPVTAHNKQARYNQMHSARILGA